MLCPPCSEASQRWLDYRLPVTVQLVAIGRQDEKHIRERTEARFREWRDTVRWQQGHIADLCASGRHAGPGTGKEASGPSASPAGSPRRGCSQVPSL